MDSVLLLARLALAAVFATAGVGKLLDRHGSAHALEEFGVPARFTRFGALVLPIAELAVATALLFATTARWGALGAALLLVLFTSGIANALAHDRAPDCHCFGQIHSEQAGKGTLVRNLCLAAVAIALGIAGPGPSLAAWAADRSTVELLFGLLLLGAFGGLAAIAGRRIPTAEPPDEGLPIGTPAPAFDLPAPNERRRYDLASLCAGGKPVVLLFVSANCPACGSLLPLVAGWQETLSECLTLAVLAQGTPTQARSLGEGGKIANLLADDAWQSFGAFAMPGTPSAVVIDPATCSIASAPGTGRLAIEETIRAVLRRGVASGPGPSSASNGPNVESVGQRLRVDASSAAVLRALQDDGIEAILLRGPSIAEWLYEPGQRTYADCDLLISPTCSERADATLRRLGYQPKYDESQMPEWWLEHAMEWFSPEAGTSIDLHRTLEGAEADPAVVWAALAGETATLVVGGHRATVLSVPARALVVVLHAAQHGAGHRAADYDLDRALARATRDTWAEAVGIGRRIDALGALAAGLRQRPAGVAIAESLDLPRSWSTSVELRAGTRAPEALTLERIHAADGAAARLGILRHKLFPPAAFLRGTSHLAARGRAGLVLAYVARLARLARQSIPSLVAWRRARRATTRGDIRSAE